MTYAEVVSEIEGKHRFGKLPGIEISRIMAEKVGNPETSLKFVHIAGTNGKGSTAAFLREIGIESSLKVGLFTSPHLITFRERIQIGHEMISEADVARIGERLLKLDLPDDVTPTMFDYCFVMAMLYFKEMDVDLVVLETGLGGRLDSTNMIELPLLSIITHIGYDHTAILGDTLDKIAKEKCGILKKGSFLITEAQESPALDTILKDASEKGLPYEVSSDYDKEISLKGEYQRRNAGCAACAAKKLAEQYPSIDDMSIERGIARAKWPGRMQILRSEPLLIIDGAHNPDGVEALKETIEKSYGGRKFDFIMGVMADKDYISMLAMLKPYIRKLTTVTVENARTLQAKDLAEECRLLGIDAKPYEEPLEVLLNSVNFDTIVFGSLYFIGEILKMLEQ